MVMKDADGSTYIGNATVIPSGKRWVYAMIYRNVFHNIYGEVTISRNKLCLTDDDTAEWGPLEDCIKRYHVGRFHFICYVCFMLSRWFIMNKFIQNYQNTKEM